MADASEGASSEKERTAEGHAVTTTVTGNIATAPSPDDDNTMASEEGKEAAGSKPFKTIIFLGSARDAAPSWNPSHDSRLGDRVLKLFQKEADKFNKESASSQPFEFEIFDVLAMPEFATVMTNPVYYKKPEDVPQAILDANAKVKDADAYVIITPEYNHSIPSALTNMMNHFGCSLYSYKPSACICYSMTPIGGPRVAAALRVFLSELGCLSVSKQAILPSCHKYISKDGDPVEGESQGQDAVKQISSTLKQLHWWATACRVQREAAGTP